MGEAYITLVNEMGLVKALTVMCLFIVITISLQAVCKELWRYVKWGFQKKLIKIDKASLLNHALFKKYHFFITQRLKHLHCLCILRKKIFADLLTIRLKTFDEKIREFLETEDLGKMSPSDFQFKTSELLYTIYSTWEESAAKQEIPAVVIDTFRQNMEPIRQTMDSFINTAPSSYYTYESSYARLNALFDMMCGFEELVLMELEQTLDNMNGEISGCTYRGFSCQHCEVCQSRHASAVRPACPVQKVLASPRE